MEWINNLLAVCIIFIGGFLFFYIFRSMFSELIKEGLLKNKDGIFILITIVLVFIVYLFLETLHH